MAKKTHHPKPGCQCVLQFWLKSVQICWNYVKISDLVATCCNNAPVDSTPKHFTPLLGRFPLEMCLKNQPENHSGRSCWRAICHTCWAITKLSWLADRPWSRPTADMLCGPTAVRRASRPAASLCKPLACTVAPIACWFAYDSASLTTQCICAIWFIFPHFSTCLWLQIGIVHV
jgi:hypothetical protein